jgi:hypothetical protein
MGRWGERPCQGEAEKERGAKPEDMIQGNEKAVHGWRVFALMVLSLAPSSALCWQNECRFAVEVWPMLTLTVIPDREEYCAQEPISLGVEIRNEGTVAVEILDPEHSSVDQPIYEITGPSFPQPKTASNLSAFRERGGDPGRLPERSTVSLAPGDSWRGGAVLDRLVGRLLPGEYRIRGSFAFQGQTASSPEQRIRVKSIEPKSVHVGQGLRPLDSGEGRLVAFTKGGGSSTLVALRFHETRPEIGEIETSPPITQFNAGPEATDVTTVWRNAPFFSELIQWTAWRESHEIKAISDASNSPDSLTLPVALSHVIRPLLQFKDEPLEVLATGEDQQLYLCVFPVDFDPKAKPRIAWHAPLPAIPEAIIAAPAPAGNNSRHIAFVTANGQGVEIFHSFYRDSGSLAEFHSVRIPEVHLVTNISPALMVESNGSARVTVIVGSKDGRSYSAVEARFKNSGAQAGTPEVLSLGSLDQPVKGGAVLYVEKAGELRKRDIAVLTQNPDRSAGTGLILRRWMATAGAWKVFAPHVTPVDPMILVPGENFSYVLCFAPGQGFFFEPL